MIRPPLAVAALLLLAGCVGFTGGTATPVADGEFDYTVANEDPDNAYVVTVGVTAGGAPGFAVEFANGTVREYPDAHSFDDVPSPVLLRAVSIRPIGDDAQARVHRFDGVESATGTFEGVPANATAYHTVALQGGAEPLRASGELRCGPGATFTEVTVTVTNATTVAVGSGCTAA